MLVSSEKLRNSGIVTVRISKVKMKFDISDWSTCLMNPPSQWQRQRQHRQLSAATTDPSCRCSDPVLTFRRTFPLSPVNPFLRPFHNMRKTFLRQMHLDYLDMRSLEVDSFLARVNLGPRNVTREQHNFCPGNFKRCYCSNL